MRRAAALLLLTALAGCGGGTSGGQTDERPAPPPERQQVPRDPVRHLPALQRIADRSDDTRAAGTDGDGRTVGYIVSTLRDAGWSVRTQTVRFPYFELRSAHVGDLARGADFRVAQYSGSGDVTALVRRVPGNGCTDADYAGLQPGEIALADRGTCYFRDKARVAARAGASALLAVDVQGDEPVSATLIRPGTQIPVVVVAGDAGAALEGKTIQVAVEAVSERRATHNVIAETAENGGRWVMAGAHHDSVTAGPGMNDNGTGVAALLAVAARLHDTPGLRLGFWAAEELGLYGSRHYVKGLAADERRAIDAYVNLDMVGSPNGRALVYDRDDRIERVLRRALGDVDDEVPLRQASDHAPFERAGIPVGGLFTGAVDKGRKAGAADRCYHRSCDAIGNVDRALLRRMTDAAEEGLARLVRSR